MSLIQPNFAVIFDMDGVIVHSNPYHKIAIRQFCQKYGFEMTEEHLVEKIYGRTNKDWITNLFGELSDTQLNQYAEEKETLFREIYAPHIQPVAGITNFIRNLEDAHIPKAIGTSAPSKNVTFVLENTQLTPYFSIILDETQVTQGKPHPEIYLKVVEVLKYPHEKCIVFEDSVSGVKSAKAAGCKVVGVLTTHNEEELSEANAFIQDFQDLDFAFLEKLIK